ncbi:MAG: ABC transporter ATP-binding protein [Lachnospiraceae bacterium]|nr:ABC transporter ATP-binding protein [Lachnospiraceae bacterium]
MENFESLLEVKDICKKYKGVKEYANRDISISVGRGEIVGLLGPNGAGKTTFVRQVCGLLKPDRGEIILNGHDIVKEPIHVTKNISYLGQIAYTHRALKVKEFLVHTGIYRGLGTVQALRQSEELLKYFNMHELKDRLLDHLSGGEVRIVAFMAAIIGLYPLIVLDEPTNDVDPEKRILLWKLVKELRIKSNISFLLVTHNIHEAQDVFDSVAIIQNGKIIKRGKPNDIAAELKISTKIIFSLPYDIFPPLMIKDRFNIEKMDDENYRIEINKEEVKYVLQSLFESSIGDKVRNIRIKLPSLEDVYVQL